MPLGLRPLDSRSFNFIMSFDLHLLWGRLSFWLALQSSALKFAMATPFLREDFSFSYLGKKNMALSTALLPRNSYLTVKHGCTSLFFTYMYIFIFIYIYMYMYICYTSLNKNIARHLYIYTSIIFTPSQQASFKKELGCFEVVAVAMLVKKWWIAWM